MIIRFSLGEDISVLKSNDYDSYLDSDLQVFIKENNDEYLFFSTTIHSTIIIHLSDILIELHRNNKKQTLDPFGNANIYTLEKKNDNLIITNIDKLSDKVDWERTFNFNDFVKAYVNTMKNYTNTMLNKNVNITEHPSFILIIDRLNLMKKYVAN